MILPKNWTANEQLLHRGIRHAAYVEQVKNHTARDAIKLLNKKVLPDVEAKLLERLLKIQSGRVHFNFTDQRLVAMRENIGAILDAGLGDVQGMMESRLGAIAQAEADYQVAAVKAAAKGVPIGEIHGPLTVAMPGKALTVPFDFVGPAPGLLQTIVKSKPFQGDVLKGWFNTISKKAQADISRQVNIGLTQGESIPELVRRIRGTSGRAFADGAGGTIRRQVEAVARTAVSHVVNEARDASFQANSDVVKRVLWVSTLDTRTCEACMALDGKTFALDDGERPPLHFGCRCSISPVLASWKELGIKGLKELPESTRASMNGQVPESVTYGKWLKGQPAEVQREVLGVGKAELFRQGKVTADRFVDDRGKVLTLAELRVREGISDN